MDINSEIKNAYLEQWNNTQAAAFDNTNSQQKGRFGFNIETGRFQIHNGTALQNIDNYSIIDTLSVDQQTLTGTDPVSVTKVVTKGSLPLIINMSGKNSTSNNSYWELSYDSDVVGGLIGLSRVLNVYRDTTLIYSSTDDRMDSPDNNGTTNNRFKYIALPDYIIDDAAAGSYTYKFEFDFGIFTRGGSANVLSDKTQAISTLINFIGN